MSVQDLSQSISEAVSAAWGTLFMKQVVLEPQAPQLLADSTETPVGTYVRCDIKFSGDIQGQYRFYVAKTEALTMVGMMMAMGADDDLVNSTREGDLGDEELDALKEGFSQLGATAATVLRDQQDCAASAELAGIEIVECEGELEGFGGEDQVITMTLSLEGYDDGIVYQILSDEYVQSLSNSPTSEPEKGTSSEVKGSKEPQDVAASIEKIRGLTVTADLILAERSMDVKHLLTLCVGSVIEFWKPCDSPADLCLQNIPIANGEVVLCQNQHFGLRVQSLAPPRNTFQKGAY